MKARTKSNTRRLELIMKLHDEAQVAFEHDDIQTLFKLCSKAEDWRLAMMRTGDRVSVDAALGLEYQMRLLLADQLIGHVGAMADDAEEDCTQFHAVETIEFMDFNLSRIRDMFYGEGDIYTMMKVQTDRVLKALQKNKPVN